MHHFFEKIYRPRNLFTEKPVLTVDRLDGLTLQSGTDAIRFLLRSYKLLKGTAVAMPAYVCDSVQSAVILEGFKPYLLELKADGSFWSDYDLVTIKNVNCSVIILTHLYGFLHPDTESVIQFSEKAGIYLIHDAAQSWGVNETKLMRGNGIVYSFGPGKSTMAAYGGLVITENGHFNSQEIRAINKYPALRLITDLRAKRFLGARMLKSISTQNNNFYDRILNRIYNRLASDQFYSLTDYQHSVAAQSMVLAQKNHAGRKERHGILMSAIQNNANLKSAYSNGNGIFFKAVIYVSNDEERFSQYLWDNRVQHYRIFQQADITVKYEQLPVFRKNATHLFVISTEACIPMTEIKRIAGLLSSFQ